MPKAPPKAKAKRGRPPRGHVVVAKPQKLVQLQSKRSLQDNLNDLPCFCNGGTKKNSKGYNSSWIGYKLHSASLHDSQAAITLAQMSSKRVTNFYDLMDAAYDSTEIDAFSHSLEHRPIIDHNPRRAQKILMDPAAKARFAERSSVERVNATLKDSYGGRTIRVKGGWKVMAHLMIGIVSVTEMKLYPIKP